MSVSTLEDFWTAEVSTYTSLQTKLTAALTSINGQLGDAKGSLAAAQAALATAQGGLSAAKAVLAAESNLGDIPADAQAARVQQARVNQASGDAARWGEAAFDLQLQADAVNAALAQVGAQLTAAQAGLDAANARNSASLGAIRRQTETP